jgi:transcriptional regulator with XRE-family HTH domain
MIEVAKLRAKRTAAGIVGIVLSRKAGMARSRLSDIERGYVTPSPDELARLDAVLDQLIEAKSVLRRTAASLGWPEGGLR